MKKGELLGKMIVIATNGHAGQFDKGGQPYILHPLAVLNLCGSKDEEIQCMCVGHDLFEDTRVTKRFLREEGFSERVIEGIWAGTHLPGEEQDEYEQRVYANRDTMTWKLADIRHNSDFSRLKGVSDKDIARMAKYQKMYWEIDKRLQAGV